MEQIAKTIGWIGTGLMGKSMCKHLLNHKYSLNVYNRTASKADELVQLGAKFMAPEEIAKNSDVIFLMVGFPKDVEEVVFKQLIGHMKEGQILVDHTSSCPKLAERIYEELKQKKIGSIDAPVSGGDRGAKEGRLAIMCGGDKEAFEEVKPILTCYGKNIQHMGKAGFGQKTKIGNQVSVGLTTLSVVESLLYAYKAGLDPIQFFNTIRTGAAGSASMELYAQRIIDGDMKPGFAIDLYMKDLGLALDDCRRMNLVLPGLQLVSQLYTSVVSYGGEKNGTQALIKILEKMNNIEFSAKKE